MATCETTTTGETTEVLKLERETCSRCGGSGTYSYCPMYGNRCFKCAGRKQLLTKRGEAALAYLTRLRSKPARELRSGDTVLHEGWCVPGAINDKTRWVQVIEARPGERERDGCCYVNGEVILPEIVVVTEACSHSTTGDRLFRVFISREHELETLRQAIAYQGSLTRAGKPRKAK